MSVITERPCGGAVSWAAHGARTPAAMPCGMTRRMYDLCRAGNYEEAMKWQYRILELFDVMLYPFEFPDGFRAAAELRGFRMGRSRQPQTGAQQADRTALASVLQCILAISSWWIARRGLCAARPAAGAGQGGTGDFEVMRELEKRGVI